MPNENSRNILLASLLSAIILIAWTWFYEKPKMAAQQQQNIITQKNLNDAKNAVNENSQTNQKADPKPNIANSNSKTTQTDQSPQEDLEMNREDSIAASQANRIAIKTPQLHGSINLEGLVFDDLTLVNYREELDPESKEVVLFSPKNTKEKYFVNFGFKSINEIANGEIPQDKLVEFPGPTTVWKSNGKTLTPETPVTFSWTNKDNIVFIIKIGVDKDYMFTINQTIQNNSNKEFPGLLTAEIQKFLPQTDSASYILHEGPIAVFDGILKEINYVGLRDRKVDETSFNAQNGWAGMTDKYWLSAIIPDKNIGFATKFSYYDQKPGDLYDAELTSKKFTVGSGKTITFENKMFAGAKKVALLDQYSKQYNLALFDRAIDFGWYYFLTKPFFFILQFFNKIFGNYGLAILAITVLVKLAMFPLANKSYGAIAKIKQLQPKIDKIRETYKDKKMQMNKEIMELYKREKVNPVSGCLPMLIQIPVFFSLYKVLSLTIDMRHAPFYGWIKDLSAPDPTSIFNLFGILPFDVSGLIHIGIWPILMGITMVVQQKLNPAPSDPAQAKIMKILPFILIFVFAPFPAGLLIYWTWSNSLSILQQWFITKKLSK